MSKINYHIRYGFNENSCRLIRSKHIRRRLNFPPMRTYVQFLKPCLKNIIIILPFATPFYFFLRLRGFSFMFAVVPVLKNFLRVGVLWVAVKEYAVFFCILTFYLCHQSIGKQRVSSINYMSNQCLHFLKRFKKINQK